MKTKLAKCPVCGGSKKVRHYLTGKVTTCPHCQGSGTIIQVVTPK